jgi:signal transduction histidine kinase/tetratricopeptide (TPR) repeat protein
MEMFALDSVVAAQEQALLDPAAPGHYSVMLALAWQLRQRDSHRAQALCQQLQAALPQLAMPGALRARWQARLCLINGEIDWLLARLDAAHACLRLAMQHNDQAERLALADGDGDTAAAAGMAAMVGYGSIADGSENRIDAQILQGWLALDLGAPSQATHAWSEAMTLATQAGDSLRCRMVQAMQAYWHVLSDRHAAREQWGGLFTADTAALAMPPALLAPVEDYFSVLASLEHDFGASITHGIAAWEAALASGQIRRAICSATSIGDDFNNLGDAHSALEWMQRALALARPTGWPGSVGLCLAQLGGTLRRLGRFDDATAALHEAMRVMVPLQASRNYGVALAYLGDLEQDCGRHAEALAHFRQLEQRALELGQLDFHIHACCAQITALAELGQGQQALDKGMQTLDLAIKEKNQPCQIEVLKSMAEVYQRYPALPFLAAGTLPVPDSSAELAYLLQAYHVAQGVAGFAMPLDLLDSLANAYDRQGDVRSAFQYTREANQVREALHGLEAGNRAIAMQVRHKTERARTEGEHHRQLAIAEAQRAETLQQTSTMLAHLGAVGQEITTHLDAQAVFLTLNSHVLNLLDASGFSVYLCDDDGLHLSRAFGLEAGNPLPPVRLAIADPNARASRCAREQREFLFDLPHPGVTWLPGTLVNRSALFAPLRLRERVLGVMAVQSLKRHAWDERALLIFRTLCAYGAIALDNAQAYLRLQEAQAKLVAKEKLAALGSLVAGVAHELNTPLGNSLMMASALEEKSRQFDARVKSGQLLLDDLLEFLAEAREAAILIMRGLSSAADLVNSFKQVAVDRTSAQWREFDLQQTIHEIIATMATRIRQAGHAIELDVAPGINLHSYPGPLGQVITNLVNNALLHAFDGKSSGQILLVARQMPEQRVQITFSDDGHGIPEQNLTRIFDPFFTTRMGQGGSGLGLSICYNIITSILNGQISVSSSTKGTRFVLDLPLAVACPHEDAVVLGDLA